jgi:hypothetical protein
MEILDGQKEAVDRGEELQQIYFELSSKIYSLQNLVRTFQFAALYEAEQGVDEENAIDYGSAFEEILTPLNRLEDKIEELFPIIHAFKNPLKSGDSERKVSGGAA